MYFFSLKDTAIAQTLVPDLGMKKTMKRSIVRIRHEENLTVAPEAELEVLVGVEVEAQKVLPPLKVKKRKT